MRAVHAAPPILTPQGILHKQRNQDIQYARSYTLGSAPAATIIREAEAAFLKTTFTETRRDRGFESLLRHGEEFQKVSVPSSRQNNRQGQSRFFSYSSRNFFAGLDPLSAAMRTYTTKSRSFDLHSRNSSRKRSTSRRSFCVRPFRL